MRKVGMGISMIAAMAADRVIGKDNTLPWRLPADLAHFKAITMGKPVLMGRKTFESIGKPLPGRRNLVVTRDAHWSAEGVEAFLGIDQALEAATDTDEVMVIGGGELYKALLPHADRLYLTRINLVVDGDTRFPEWDDGTWRKVASVTQQPDERNQYHYSFERWDRVKA